MFLFKVKKKIENQLASAFDNGMDDEALNEDSIDALAVFKQHFLDLEGEKLFPYDLALSALNDVKKSVRTMDDFMSCLLEDCIYTSVYATFFEQLFSMLPQHVGLSDKLIEKFSLDSEEREKMISSLAFNHVSYVENEGCSGCASCENHHDVDDIIPYWKARDLDFFIKLYVGMQTIQFTFEQILYDLLPGNQQLVRNIKSEQILELRKFLFGYAEKRLTSN